MSTSLENQIISPVRHELRREALELGKMVCVFLVLFWFLKSFVIEGYEVQGPSMNPTIVDHERILVFKLPHQLTRLPFLRGYEAIKPGHIVVFDSHDASKKRYIKRVIAEMAPAGNTVSAAARESAPGVAVRYDRGAVYVNNRRIEEGYLAPENRTSHEIDEADLKPGEFYVLGDNRRESKDSRVFGPVSNEQIIGEAVLRFWPLNRIGFL